MDVNRRYFVGVLHRVVLDYGCGAAASTAAQGRRIHPLLSRFDGLQTMALRRLAFLALEMRRR
jgi:hypothetical protein